MNKESIMKKHDEMIAEARELEAQAKKLRWGAEAIKTDLWSFISGITPNKSVIQSKRGRWIVTKLQSNAWGEVRAYEGRKIKKDGTPGVVSTYIRMADQDGATVIGEWDGKQIVEIPK